MSRITSGASSGRATTSPRSSARTPNATTPLALLRKQSAAITSRTGLAVRRMALARWCSPIGCGRRLSRIGRRAAAKRGSSPPIRAAPRPAAMAATTWPAWGIKDGAVRSVGERPLKMAPSTSPPTMPSGTPASATAPTSTANSLNTCRDEAPAARSKPISRRRSYAARAALLAVTPAPTIRLNTVASASSGWRSSSGAPAPARGL